MRDQHHRHNHPGVHTHHPYRHYGPHNATHHATHTYNPGTDHHRNEGRNRYSAWYTRWDDDDQFHSSGLSAGRGERNERRLDVVGMKFIVSHTRPDDNVSVQNGTILSSFASSKTYTFDAIVKDIHIGRQSSTVVGVGTGALSLASRDGNSSAAAAMFSNPVVSRKHAVFRFVSSTDLDVDDVGNSTKTHITLTDLASHHGTHVSPPSTTLNPTTTKLTPHKSHRLSDGDTITFGKSVWSRGEEVLPVSVRVQFVYGPASRAQSAARNSTSVTPVLALAKASVERKRRERERERERAGEPGRERQQERPKSKLQTIDLTTPSPSPSPEPEIVEVAAPPSNQKAAAPTVPSGSSNTGLFGSGGGHGRYGIPPDQAYSDVEEAEEGERNSDGEGEEEIIDNDGDERDKSVFCHEYTSDEEESEAHSISSSSRSSSSDSDVHSLYSHSDAEVHSDVDANEHHEVTHTETSGESASASASAPQISKSGSLPFVSSLGMLASAGPLARMCSVHSQAQPQYEGQSQSQSQPHSQSEAQTQPLGQSLPSLNPQQRQLYLLQQQQRMIQQSYFSSSQSSQSQDEPYYYQPQSQSPSQDESQRSQPFSQSQSQPQSQSHSQPSQVAQIVPDILAPVGQSGPGGQAQPPYPFSSSALPPMVSFPPPSSSYLLGTGFETNQLPQQLPPISQLTAPRPSFPFNFSFQLPGLRNVLNPIIPLVADLNTSRDEKEPAQEQEREADQSHDHDELPSRASSPMELSDGDHEDDDDDEEMVEEVKEVPGEQNRHGAVPHEREGEGEKEKVKESGGGEGNFTRGRVLGRGCYDHLPSLPTPPEPQQQQQQREEEPGSGLKWPVELDVMADMYDELRDDLGLDPIRRDHLAESHPPRLQTAPSPLIMSPSSGPSLPTTPSPLATSPSPPLRLQTVSPPPIMSPSPGPSLQTASPFIMSTSPPTPSPPALGSSQPMMMDYMTPSPLTGMGSTTTSIEADRRVHDDGGEGERTGWTLPPSFDPVLVLQDSQSSVGEGAQDDQHKADAVQDERGEDSADAEGKGAEEGNPTMSDHSLLALRDFLSASARYGTGARPAIYQQAKDKEGDPKRAERREEEEEEVEEEGGEFERMGHSVAAVIAEEVVRAERAERVEQAEEKRVTPVVDALEEAVMPTPVRVGEPEERREWEEVRRRAAELRAMLEKRRNAVISAAAPTPSTSAVVGVGAGASVVGNVDGDVQMAGNGDLEEAGEEEEEEEGSDDLEDDLDVFVGQEEPHRPLGSSENALVKETFEASIAALQTQLTDLRARHTVVSSTTAKHVASVALLESNARNSLSAQQYTNGDVAHRLTSLEARIKSLEGRHERLVANLTERVKNLETAVKQEKAKSKLSEEVWMVTHDRLRTEMKARMDAFDVDLARLRPQVEAVENLTNTCLDEIKLAQQQVQPAPAGGLVASSSVSSASSSWVPPSPVTPPTQMRSITESTYTAASGAVEAPSPSLKRKRAVVEEDIFSPSHSSMGSDYGDDDDGDHFMDAVDVSQAQVVEEQPPPAKRSRVKRAAKTVLRAAGVATVGAVAAWTALAFAP